MRTGGSSAKGASFERSVAGKLSLWLTAGKDRDALSRNTSSGGRFTSTERGIPGDIMAVHPAAFEFCSKVTIECKHYKDINLDRFITHGERSFLGRVFNKTKAQCNKHGYIPAIIAKSNNSPTFFICEAELGNTIIRARSSSRQFNYHWLHMSKYFMCELDDLLAWIDPRIFLADLRKNEIKSVQ